jgi:methylenetetrahydrofolate dehydrogenase (NADP+)/methenyltetrahydrofolate cyclohydrolase
VGDDPASQVYVRSKSRAAEETGITAWTHRLPANTTQDELLVLIDTLNTDPKVDGILVQLPLPHHIDPHIITAAVDPDKDVDGFHPINVGRLSLGLPCLLPCTPQGCMILMNEAIALPDMSGKRALMIGSSNIVGRPLAQLLLQAHCTVTIAHSRTRDLPNLCREAEILCVAIGKPEFIRGEWIKEGAIVIDVGINRIADPGNPGKNRLVGDVEFAAASARAAAITPVPGGVGPMTIACLMKNTVKSAENRE